ncbi:MAG: alpha/beta hydrolase [Acidobacteria bacterium]|nr:MAG: alpha/beta hydrolase [Acidobacteriota bacterium]REK11050.1 MAG: alpha/beta hydrolase [Acidobacteriota bacterium]
MRNPLADIVGPASQFYVSQRLRLHYLDWGNEEKPLLLLVHGGRDHAHNWDWVAKALRDDFHIVAPDLRGHGNSQWAIGGMYAISDFVLDIAQLLEALDQFPVAIVAHSLGGMISLQYTGLYPDRVSKIVAIEGLGPSPERLAELRQREAHERLVGWISEMQGLAARHPRHYPSVEAAARRMQEVNSFLSAEQARHLTVHGVARNEDGTYGWKFDNYVRAGAPFRMDEDEIRAIWNRITCPTLLVRGTESWASDPVEDGRIEAFRNAELRNFDGAGHWVHHDRTDDFIEVVREFLLG